MFIIVSYFNVLFWNELAYKEREREGGENYLKMSLMLLVLRVILSTLLAVRSFYDADNISCKYKMI
jgi:hypothetical protein